MADDEEAALRQLRAEVVVPGHHLRAEAHDHQDRRVTGVPEGLVTDLDLADAAEGLGHGRKRSVQRMRRHEVRATGGRVLVAIEAGDPDGVPVLYHHGTPGSGLLYPAWSADAAERGIRLIGYDRSGYGGSDRNRGRTVADVAADAAAIADSSSCARCSARPTWPS